MALTKTASSVSGIGTYATGMSAYDVFEGIRLAGDRGLLCMC